MSTAPVQVLIATSERPSDAIQKDHDATFVYRRPDFERVFLKQAASQMFDPAAHPAAEVPQSAADLLLRRHGTNKDEYGDDGVQSLWIGWQMAIDDGAIGAANNDRVRRLAASLASEQLHARTLDAALTELKARMQMLDRTFATKIRLTALMKFLKKVSDALSGKR